LTSAANCLHFEALAKNKLHLASPPELLSMHHQSRTESYRASDMRGAYVSMVQEGDTYVEFKSLLTALWCYQTAALGLQRLGDVEWVDKSQAKADELISANPGLKEELTALGPLGDNANVSVPVPTPITA